MPRKTRVTSARATSAATSSKPTTSKRMERQIATRRKILDAAARVIGRYGYGGCSVARVTAKARMAHGTFYLYFKSQQRLFDTILPTLGGEMLASIAEAIGHETDPMKVERLGFTANVAYTLAHPYMNRVLYEAQHYAPKAYAKWLEGIVESYVRSFRRTLTRGTFYEASDEHLHMVAMMMVNARTALLFTIDGKTAGEPERVEDMIDTYLKFVQNGLGI